MEIRRLPYSEHTQTLSDQIQEMRKSMDKYFLLHNPKPKYDLIQKHRLAVEKNLKAATEVLLKMIAVDPKGQVICLTNEEYAKLYVPNRSEK